MRVLRTATGWGGYSSSNRAGFSGSAMGLIAQYDEFQQTEAKAGS